MEKRSIPNALADFILLVSLDDNSTLTPNVQPPGEILQTIFSCDFTPQVLSAVSATDMVNFFPYPHIVHNYPPADKMAFSGELQGDLKCRLSNGSKTINPKKNPFSKTIHPAIIARNMSVRKGALLMKTPAILPELPINNERLQSMPFLCFPDGLKVYRQPQENRVHYVVLTDINGKYSYGTCITFYRAFLIEKDDLENLYMEFDGQPSVEPVEETKVRCYIPHCLIMGSQFPYYTQMKDCLSSLVSSISQDPEEIVTFLKEYAHILTNTPVPPPGNVSLVFDLYKLPVTLMPPSHPGKPVIDFPLHLIFSCFKAEEFLKILACILREESIVFLSANIAVLTFIMEGVRNLILPFQWRFSYAPVLPDIGYLQALNPFLFGCHSRYRQEAEQVPGLVIVDIDRGEVRAVPLETGEPCDMYLPDDASCVFLLRAPRFLLNFDCIEAQSPSYFSIEEVRESRRKCIEDKNEIIVNTCLELMVNLFRGVVAKLNTEHKHFNREQFLNELKPTDKKFYKKVFQTDMFKIFLEQRINEEQDYWYDLEIRSRGINHSKSGSSVGPVNKRVLRKQQTISQIFLSERREITPYYLPDPANRQHFIAIGIRELSHKYQECPDYDQRSSFLYLRAMFHVANGDKMAAIDDLISLSITNSKLIPVDVVTDLYKKMSSDQVTKFKRLPDNALLLDIIEEHLIEGHTDHGLKRVRMDPIKIPDEDIDFERFQEYVALKMTNDFDTIQRLFSALTSDMIHTHIDKETFETFVAVWESNQEHCDSVKVDEGHLRDDEIILKVSAIRKTDYGLGRLVLTDRKLFFVSDVSNHYKFVTQLRDIMSIRKEKLSTVFSTVDVLQIKCSNSVVFNAHLKEECDCWNLVVKEMWAGKVVAESTKDIMAITHAVHNALLINAVFLSCPDDSPPMSSIDGLCTYTKYKEKNKHKLPRETYEILLRKIDPNSGERDRKTVQALLYTGGEENTVPRLWVGLSTGKIKVYNAITFDLDSEFLQAKPNCVACLKAVGDKQVWAGSIGIYIIDAQTITCKKTMMDHSDLVVDIATIDKYVYSASLDGTIIKWDANKLTHAMPKIELPKKDFPNLRSIKIQKDKLICGTWTCLLVCDLQGRPLSYLTFFDSGLNKCMELDSFIPVDNNQIWAGFRREGRIMIWNSATGKQLGTIEMQDSCKGVSAMMQVDGKVWVGTKDGTIYIYNQDRTLWKALHAHDDAVRVLCDVRDRASHMTCHLARYMISGGGSKDGKVCIWNAAHQSTDSGSFSDSAEIMLQTKAASK